MKKKLRQKMLLEQKKLEMQIAQLEGQLTGEGGEDEDLLLDDGVRPL